MNKKTFITKNNGDSLQASEWNELTGYTNEIVDAVNQSGGGSGLPNFYINSKGNLNIETSPEIGNTSKGKINIEAMDDIQLKPGDDIILYSHHRAQDKQDEVAVKVTDGDDIPVKLQVNAAEMTLTTKDKTGDDAEVFDINVNSGKNSKGYLKVRARAIDLRCEDHGGVALQPKGKDSNNFQNKIKFEHGGGDGLEFGTFNTEKASLFTDEYRFNKDGVWKMATREKEVSDKYDSVDETTHYKYVKQADDFYDIVDNSDAQCTTRDIIKTAAALNGTSGIHTHMTSKGNLEIESNAMWQVLEDQELTYTQVGIVSADRLTKLHPANLPNTPHTLTELLSCFGTETYELIDSEGVVLSVDTVNQMDAVEIVYDILQSIDESSSDFVKFTKVSSPDINIESDSNIKITAQNKIKFGGELDFGSSFNFGETDNGIETQYKLTKKNATKDCGIVKVVGVNNHATNNLVVNDATIAPGTSQVVAQASTLDIVNLASAIAGTKNSLEKAAMVQVEILSGTPTYDASYSASATDTYFSNGNNYTDNDLAQAVVEGHIDSGILIGINAVLNGTDDEYTVKITYNSSDDYYYKFTLSDDFNTALYYDRSKIYFSDIVKLVKYMQENNQGPWANNL